MMDDYRTFSLLNEMDLLNITGLTRPTAQAKWFQQNLGVLPLLRADGHLVMTWPVFDALLAKQAGLEGAGKRLERPPIMSIRKVG